MEQIIRGQSFVANDFEVKVALKKDFIQGHKIVKVDINSEHMKTGLKTCFSERIYDWDYSIQNKKYFEMLNWAKRYFSAPIQSFIK